MHLGDGLGNGKFNGLMHIGNELYTLTMVATDQRGSMRRMINPDDPKSVTAEQLSEVKSKLIKYLAGKRSPVETSGILVDPQYSYTRDFIRDCDLRATTGLLMGIEETGAGPLGEFAPKIRIFDKLSAEEGVRRIKNRGADAVKLLVYFHPDGPTREYQQNKVKEIGQACEKYDMTFLVEPVSHSLEDGPHKKKEPKKFSKTKPYIVIETARELTKPEYCLDILKAEFPVNLKLYEELEQDPLSICRELVEVSRVPTVILSAGVDYDEFKKNLDYALRAGVSGFLCGRAIWKEAIGNENPEAFLETTAVERVNELASMVKERGKPWYKWFVDSISDIELIRGE